MLKLSFLLLKVTLRDPDQVTVTAARPPFSAFTVTCEPGHTELFHRDGRGSRTDLVSGALSY